MLTRRQFLDNATLLGAGTALSALLPPWARSAASPARPPAGGAVLSGQEFDLEIAPTTVEIDGRPGRAITVNGQLPAPLLRWREGDDITLRVTNRLEEDTSIHWHGILLPAGMDGVPGVSFPGIRPGETFTYRFPVRQAGTYWYHSHSGLQEQAGHYGPLVIDPREASPVPADREYVLVLSDWTFLDPHSVFDRLKKNSESFNFQKRTLGDLARDVTTNGLGPTLADRLMWGAMRMSPTDIADVTGETYTYLVNGHGPGDNWTGLFRPGERVRLRVINASAMTFFNVRLPGLPLTVVQADGLDVKPVQVDEFQIGVAETYDIVVTPPADKAYTIMCESMDRSGYGRATLAPRPGMSAPVPALRERPLLTMKDMAMGGHAPDKADGHQAGHGDGHSNGHDGGHSDGHDGGHDGGDHIAMPPVQAPMAHPPLPQRHDHPRGPGVANLARYPANRLSEPGLGQQAVGHRVLVYSDLESLVPNPDTRVPGREMEIHLTGNMERYMWSFDGTKLSEIDGPIIFRLGERLRLHLVNDTMMAHPIHLHGMFFDVVTGEHAHKPRKHTISVKPGEKLAIDITADAPGDWAFHCHLLYHMHAGMMQIVSVRPDKSDGPA